MPDRETRTRPLSREEVKKRASALMKKRSGLELDSTDTSPNKAGKITEQINELAEQAGLSVTAVERIGNGFNAWQPMRKELADELRAAGYIE